MKLTLSPRLCARLYPLFPWNRGLLILLAFTTLAAGPGVVLYDADPFLVPTAGVLATFSAPNWTSKASGLPGGLNLTVERYLPASGLGHPQARTLSPVPPTAAYALVNQVAPDIAFFSYSGVTTVAPGNFGKRGMSDSWQIQYFGKTGIDPLADADGDGFTNLAEFLAGTDPTNSASAPVIPGLLARWPGDANAVDPIGGHNGIWSGTEAYIPGRLGSAFSLDGASTITIADAPELQLTDELTISGWVRLSALPCAPSPILVRPSSTPGIPAFGVWVDCGGPRLGLSTGAQKNVDGPSVSLATNVWYHLAVTWDGTDFGLYLNGHIAYGRQVAGGFGPQEIVPGAGLIIGGDGTSAFLTGAVDELALMNRALSDNEVLLLAGGDAGPRGAIQDDSLLVEYSDQTVWLLGTDGSNPLFLTHGHDARLSADREQLLVRRDQTQPGNPTFEQLWRRDLVSGSESALSTIDRPAPDLSVDWAADGVAVEIADASRSQIYRQEILSGDQTLLIDTTPSGGTPGQLTVGRYDGRLAWTSTGGAANALWTADSDGALPTAFPGSAPSDAFPAWAPDGTQLVFLSATRPFTAISDGSQRRPLFSGPLPFVPCTVSGPVWTSGGGAIAMAVAADAVSSPDRVAWVTTDGSGDANILPLGAGALRSVIFAGNLSPGATQAPSTNLVVQIQVATPNAGGSPVLQFLLPPGTANVFLESVDALQNSWQPEIAEVQTGNSQRWLEIPLPPAVTARFYRLRGR